MVRNVDGTAEIYYDDIFQDGIPIWCLLYYIFVALFSYVNIILMGMLFYGAYINRGYHVNLK